MLFSQKKLFELLSNSVKYGNLKIITPKNTVHEFSGNLPAETAEIKINSWKLLPLVAAKGDVGLGLAYIYGYFDTPDLTTLLTLLCRNLDELSLLNRPNMLWNIILRTIDFFHKDTQKQSEKNISSHYNIGNDFYKLWLDKSMTYSSALFKTESEDLTTAQMNKYHRILNKFKDKFGDKNISALEIGCGFGGFAEEALKYKNIYLTSLTNSKSQHAYAKNRLKKDLEEKNIDLLLTDYRKVKDKFNAIASIGMFEHVGKEYWDEYFTFINNHLKEGGIAVIQSIFIKPKYFEGYSHSSDFIRQYIFPGGFLPSDEIIMQRAEKNGLKTTDSFYFGLNYAKTLSIWLDNFNRKIDEVKKMGFDDLFIRKWRYYLSSCIAAFTAERISVGQFTFEHK